jgi:hypothetical protein
VCVSHRRQSPPANLITVSSDKVWKHVFEQAGLRLIREEVQDGLPEGLFVVKM